MSFQKHKLAVLMSLLSLSATSVFAQDMPSSATVLEFGGSNTLFVADSDAGKVNAYILPDVEAFEGNPRSYNLNSFGAQVAVHLDVYQPSIIFHDVIVHPVSREAFVSLSADTDSGKTPFVVRVNHDGDLSALDLAGEHSSVTLTGAADDSVTFWRDIPASTFAVTDLDFVEGELFVSGLTTGEFSSTLRRIPYPFDGETHTSSIEMYHALHGQNETRAPIQAMEVVTLNGEPTVVAAYTCTPLVTVPVDQLNDGEHVLGKTIAELGYGNTPLDVLSFSATSRQGREEEFVLVLNREKAADLIRMTDLSTAVEADSITAKAGPGQTLGVTTSIVPMTGVLQAADQDSEFLLALQRNLETGDMDLVSYTKGSYIRISQYLNEYDFDTYSYPDNARIRDFHNDFKTKEGFEDHIK